MAIYNGTSGNDTLSGSSGAVNDTLNGGLGDDTYWIRAGSGNDIITDTGGTDRLVLELNYGDIPPDVYRGGFGEKDLIIDFNGYGRITIVGQFLDAPIVNSFSIAFPDDWIWGPFSISNGMVGLNSMNLLVGTSGSETITGNTGEDQIFAGIGNDTVSGGAGEDEIFDGVGNDSVDGGEDDDWLHAEGGSNVLDGGTGWDAVTYERATQGIVVNLSGQTQGTLVNAHVLQSAGGEDTLVGIEEVLGSGFDDVFYGGRTSGSNADLYNPGEVMFQGRAGNDVFHVGGSTGGDGAWSDVSYGDDTTGIVVNLSNSNITVDSVTVDARTARDGAGDTDVFILSGDRLGIIGSDYGDYIVGQSNISNYWLNGRAGDDTIIGGSSQHDHAGFSGGHEIFGAIVNLSASDITVSGTTGVTGVASGVTVSSNHARDSYGDTDTLVSIENASGSSLNDYIVGGAVGAWNDGRDGNDTLIGGAGGDTLIGGEGDDVLKGLDGHDSLLGGDGADWLKGHAGNDTLDGGYQTGWSDYNFASYDNEDVVVGINVNLSGITGDGSVGWGTVQDGQGGTDTLININSIVGSRLDDAMTGSSALIFEQFEGGNGDDTINGGVISNEQINSNRAAYWSASGAVTVNLSTGTSTGAAGNDTLININWAVGSGYNDAITGSSGKNQLEGGAGNDTLDGGSGIDTMVGGDGNDYYYVRDAGDAVSETNATASTGGTDRVYSYLSSYTLGTNVEEGRIMSSGTASLTGNSLNNLLYAGAGNNVIAGSTGTDSVSFYYGLASGATTGVTVTLSGGNGTTSGGSGTDTLTGIERLYGTNNADKFTGDTAANYLSGYAGNDTLDGGAGIDTLVGGDGNDYYYVRDVGDVVSETNATASTGGTDRVYSYLSSYTLGTNVEEGRILSGGTASLTGNSLNNLLYAGAGNNVIAGGAGTDSVSFYYGLASGVTTGVTVTLSGGNGTATGGSGTDTLTGIERLYGTNNADKFTGDSNANYLYGYAGNDTIDGGAGIDTMVGGDGNDYYYVRDVGDVVSETNATASTGGTDRVYSYLSSYALGTNVEEGRIMSSGTANLTGNSLNNLLYAGAGNNVIAGGAGTDSVSFYYGLASGVTTGVTATLSGGNSTATGGSGTDTLTSIERLYGTNYADKFTGDTAANYLYGYAGNDTLSGGSGNDTLVGGVGKDSLTGGSGNDLFDFNALSEMGTTSSTWDVITDFVTGDRIDLSTLDANTGTAANDAFSAITVGGAFTGTFGSSAGTLYFDNVSHVLYGNADADTSAEFAIQLTTVSTLATSDFIL